MRVINGFDEAKSILWRQPSAEFYTVSAGVRARIKEVFGRQLNPEQAVRKIVEGVRKRGDSAVLEYTAKIDKVNLASLKVTKTQIRKAYREVDAELVSALKLAAKRIYDFHLEQRREIIEGKLDSETARLVRPLERVGLYVPGGTASYPSTVLMTAIPAKVAGVKEVVLTTPPRSDGTIPPATLVAADIAQVDRIFPIGGAQAIAAMAFGTESVPKVDKICGPGNIFVVLAKKMVFGTVDIDSLPGPSEVLIIADETADPESCAADLLAQAEHDTLASAILITDSPKLADKVNKAVNRQLKSLPRRAIATESLEDKGAIVIVKNVDEAIELANLYAPEHLCLMMDKASQYIPRINNAGCIVAGKNATVVLGDYVAGPSHVLPTSGTARFSSPLNINDFVKFIDLINADKLDMNELGKAAAVIARAEGLEAHARAVEKRMGG